MRNNHPDPAPDFTNAFLTTLGGLLFMGLWVITSLAGMIVTLVVATLIDRVFKHMRRGRA